MATPGVCHLDSESGWMKVKEIQDIKGELENLDKLLRGALLKSKMADFSHKALRVLKPVSYTHLTLPTKRIV